MGVAAAIQKIAVIIIMRKKQENDDNLSDIEFV